MKDGGESLSRATSNRNRTVTAASTSCESCNIRNIEHSALSARIISGSIGSIITSLAVTPLEVVKVRIQASSVEVTTTSVPSNVKVKLSLPANVSPCPRGCGTFVLNNGHLDCVLPKSAASFFDKTTGQLTERAKQSLSRTAGSTELGTISTLRRIFQSEGIGGLYAGLRPTLVMAVPNTVLYFSAYEELVWRLRTYTGSAVATGGDAVDNWIPLVGGGAARFVASTTTAPFEFLRTRQASMVGSGMGNNVGSGIVSDFSSIIRNEGFRSLYQGLLPTLWRDVPFSAIYWLSIENLRHMWRVRRLDSPGDIRPQPLEQALQAFINGAVSGMIAAACTTPFDVVKTRQQQQVQNLFQHQPAVAGGNGSSAVVVACTHNGAPAYELPSTTPGRSSSNTNGGMFRSLTEIVEREGLGGLWRGNQARMLKVAPSCAIMISSYELGKRILVDE